MDEDGEVLVWIGEALTPTQNPQPETDEESPYHLVAHEYFDQAGYFRDSAVQ